MSFITFTGPVLLNTCDQLEADELKQTFIYSEASWELLQSYAIVTLSTQSLEGKRSNSEIDVSVTSFVIPSHWKGELSNQCKLKTPFSFSFKRGTGLENWQRTHHIIVHTYINAWKHQINFRYETLGSKLWRANMKTFWRVIECLTNMSLKVPCLKYNGKIEIILEKWNMFADILEKKFHC
jgi:hypothetical protein